MPSISVMPCCAACSNKQFYGCGKTFHRFPHANDDLLRQWIVNIGLRDCVPSKTSVVCSDHFEQQCFNRTGQTVRLRDGAVPTIFTHQRSSSKVKKVVMEESSVKPAVPVNQPSDAQETRPVPVVMLVPIHVTESSLQTENLSFSSMNQTGENKDSAARVQLLSLNLFGFQKSGYLCDTVIVADDGHVKAHGAVLAAVSPVFRRVLKSSDEPVPHVVVLPGLKVAVVNIIIQLVYTGKVVIPKSECVDVVKIVRAINDLGIQLLISGDADESRAHSLPNPDHRNSSSNDVEGRQQPASETRPTTDSNCRLKETLAEDDKSERKHSHPTEDEESNRALSPMNNDVASVADDRTADVSTVDDSKVSDVCGWTYSNSQPLAAAYMQSQNEQPELYVCDICGVTFDVRQKFLQHLGRHRRSESGAVCHICGYICRHSKNTMSLAFQQHMRKHTGEKPFKCRHCSCAFSAKKNMERHETLHDEARQFLCQLCARSFQQRAGLASHMFRYHRDSLDPDSTNRPYRCRLCGERFYVQYHLKQHMRKHDSRRSPIQEDPSDGAKAYGCNLCDVSFSSAVCLGRHVLAHDTSYVSLAHKCQLCGEQFEDLTALESHVTAVHSTSRRQYECTECQKVFVTEGKFKQHLSLHETGGERCRPFGCAVCDIAYTTVARLIRHLEAHRDDDDVGSMYKCMLCNDRFEWVTELKQHLAETHGISQPQHQCDKCAKSFGNASQLKSHLRFHAGKVFSCNVCDMRFEQAGTLKVHMITHLSAEEKARGDERLCCPVCGKQFLYKCSLDLHRRVHSGTKPYVCNVCGRAFSQRPHLTQHSRTHTRLRPFSCHVCGKSYSFRVDLRNHCSRVHNVVLPVRRRRHIYSHGDTLEPSSPGEPMSDLIDAQIQ